VPTCTVCGEDKEVEAFPFKNKAAGRRHHECKACMAAYGREHYTRHRQAYISRNVANMRVRRRAVKERVWHHLANQACVDCGEPDPLVPDFDQVDPKNKRKEIYWLAQGNHAWKTILEEIGKCEVRCANCHRLRTAYQFSWHIPADSALEAHERRRLLRPLVLEPGSAVAPANVPAGCLWFRRCGAVKPVREFYASMPSMCAECFRTYRQGHYRLNREVYVERNARVLRNRRRRWMRRLWGYLADHLCIDCGPSDPRVLEFDHRDGEVKAQSVTWMAHRGLAWESILVEVAKV
jgi:hypothetical protein